jgi:riboflavin synthase
MFTGIVTGTFPVVELVEKAGLTSFALELDAAHLAGLQVGASVSIEGVCMTATKVEGHRAHFDAAAETLRLTTLGRLRLGSRVNVERSAKAGAEIGGHPISGHIDGMADVIAVERPANNFVVTFRIPPAYVRYVFNKGFVALNGCSLTVCDLDKATGQFRVYLIPETLRLTTFDTLKPGDRVNFEIDRQTQVVVDTVFAAVQAALGEAKSAK